MSQKNYPKIAILGAGSFGCALAKLLAEKKIPVSVWARRQKVAEEINSGSNEQYLPGIKLSGIFSSSSFEEVLKDSKVVLISIPSSHVKKTLLSAKEFIPKDAILLHAIKGFDEDGNFISTLLSDMFPEHTIAALSGPNHAEEIVINLPTATVIASKSKKAREMLCGLFETEWMRAYPLDDIIGVEVCGAAKNVIALEIGVCDGMGLGDNAKGSIVTLGLSEMVKLTEALGGKRGTCYGLAGIGDLLATCYSKNSRNHFFGEMLGKGKTKSEIIEEMNGMVAEGVRNAKTLYALSKKLKIETPLIFEAHAVLYEGKSLKSAVKSIFSLV